MTGADLLALAVYGLVAVQLGRRVLALFPTRPPLLAGWAPALLAGQLALAAAALASGWLPLSLPAIGLGLLLLAAATGIRDLLRLRQRTAGGSPGSPAGSELRWSLLSAASLVALYPNVLFWILRRPVVDWDARSIWFFHARVLFADRGLDPSLFTDPSALHSAYPLLLPAQGAWLALVRDALTGAGWSDVAVKSFLLLNFAAYFHLLWKLLRARGFPAWLGLAAAVLFFDTGPRAAGLDAFGYGEVNGYADAHYIAAFLLALLAFSLPRREGGPELGILLLAFGANVKLESGLYALLLAAAAGAVAVALTLARRKPRFPGRLVSAGLAAGGIPMALWALFRARYGIGSPMDPLRWLGDPSGAAALVSERAGEIAATLGGLWVTRGGLWLAAVGIALWAARFARGRGPAPKTPTPVGRSTGAARAEIAGAAALALIPAVIFLIYALTPLELDVHLRTSADRLLFFPLALLYGLVLLALARLIEDRRPRTT